MGLFGFIKDAVSEKINEELKKACEDNNIEKVEQLIKEGVNIHAENDLAAKIASENGHYNLLKILLK